MKAIGRCFIEGGAELYCADNMRDIILERGTGTSVAVPHQIPEEKAAFIDLHSWRQGVRPA